MRKTAIINANGIIGLAVLTLLTAAFIAGQARATRQAALAGEAAIGGRAININLTLDYDPLPVVEVGKALVN